MDLLVFHFKYNNHINLLINDSKQFLNSEHNIQARTYSIINNY